MKEGLIMFLSSKNIPSFAVNSVKRSNCTKLALAAMMGLFAISSTVAYGETTTPAPTVDSLGREDISTSYVWVNSDSTDSNAYYIPTYNEETGMLEDHYYTLQIKNGVTSHPSTGQFLHSGTDEAIISHFFNRTHSKTDSLSYAAGLYNSGTIGSVVGDFIHNVTITENPNNPNVTGSSHGAGLDNHKTIGTVVGDFIGNNIQLNVSGVPSNGINSGAGLRNSAGSIDSVTGNFIANSANSSVDGTDVYGGGLANIQGATLGSLKGIFISNSAKSGGGGIYNTGVINSIEADFINNQAGVSYTLDGTKSTVDASGGAIYNGGSASNLASVNGSFIANSATDKGGAICNTDGAKANISGNFILNSAKNGGAVYNDSVNQQGSNLTIDGNFVNNTATEHGGAIYSKSDIDLLADGHTNVIKGNTSNGTDEAIYMEGTAAQPAVYDENDPTQVVTPAVAEKKPNLNLITNNNGRWVIYDSINGTNGLYNVNMNGGGTVSLYNDINGGNVYLNDGTTLDTVNNEVHTYNVNEFTVTGDSSMKVDVDIQNQEMDRIATVDGTDNYGDENGNGNVGTLNVDGFHFINDSKTGTATILFAEEELAKNVLNNGKAYDDPDNNNRVITPARIYDIGYSIHSDNRGYFEFSNQWNPAILAAPVVLQAGVQSAMNTTMLHAFNHLDTYTKIPKFDRLTMMNNQNRYALSTDFNDNNSPLRQYNLRENRTTNEGVWFRPYAMFESIPLKNGPKVDSITYGSFLGYDSDFREHKHGWHSVWSTYLGYQGGQLDFRGVDASLNGGVLGITDTFYKGNFWTAMTLTGGAMNANISTMYGHEDSVSIYGGIASKTGYNFEFKDGKYIIQPIMLASYTFANMLDYKNAAGVKIDANTMHTIQMNPSLRFITNLKNGWQPYARVGMVWNFLNETDMNAYGYHLPDMHIKPYVEYGLGIQKLYNHRFTGFAQAMMRNGGRNGVAVTLGFRYALGREGNDEEFSKMTPWEKFKAFFK